MVFTSGQQLSLVLWVLTALRARQGERLTQFEFKKEKPLICVYNRVMAEVKHGWVNLNWQFMQIAISLFLLVPIFIIRWRCMTLQSNPDKYLQTTARVSVMSETGHITLSFNDQLLDLPL